MKEREINANKEITLLRDKEVIFTKENTRLRSEIDALRARVVRSEQLAPDAQDMQVELASVRASIYDAKSKNEALLYGILCS